MEENIEVNNNVNNEVSKVKVSYNFSSIDSNKAYLGDIINYYNNNTNKKYVFCGKNNDFPEYVNGLYQNCSLFEAAVDNLVNYIIGEGIEGNDYIINEKEELLSDVINKCVFDYVLNGAFTCHIIRSATGKIVEIYHIDYKRFRVNEEETIAYLARDWNKWGNKPIELPIYRKDSKEPSSVFYFKGFKSVDTYPIPFYIGSLRSIESYIEVDNYWLNSVQNDFSPSTMMFLREGKPEIEEQVEIEKGLTKKFGGSQKSGRLLLSFCDNPDSYPIIERLEVTDFGERYQSLIKQCKENIYNSFKIPSVLIGGSDQSKGFSETEFKSAFVLYQKTIVSGFQKQIERGFERIGIDFNFIMFDTSGFDNGSDIKDGEDTIEDNIDPVEEAIKKNKDKKIKNNKK